MSNAFDLVCPACGADHAVDVAATVWVRVTPDGTDADLSFDGSHEFGRDSAARCAACGHAAPMLAFESAGPAAAPWTPLVGECDGLEIHPCETVAIASSGAAVFEQCEPDTAEFWSVFGHLQRGGLDAIADFATEAEAERFAALLQRVWPNLGDEGAG